jgi:protein ImuB
MLCALYIPDFIAAAAMRLEPELRARPLAVLEGKPPLVRVVAMNVAARLAGIEAGMTKMQAEALAGVVLRQRSETHEAAAQAALLDAAHAFSPRVEAVASGTVLLDLTGLERIFGPPAAIARDVAQRASDLGLEANVAVAMNREAAIHAARGFAGVTVIAAGEEAHRLGMLPVDVLVMEPPAGSSEIPTLRQKKAKGWGTQGKDGPELLESLERWGVRTLRALAALPTPALSERLGQRGVLLQRWARGEGTTTLAPAEPPLVFEEEIELEHPIELLEPLAFVLNRMLEQLCTRLASRALSANELTLQLTLDGAVRDEDDSPRRHEDTKEPVSRFAFQVSRNSGDERETRNTERETPSFVSSCLRGEQHVRVLRLPVPMRDARTFLKLLQLDLNAHPPGAPVIKVRLAAEPARPQVTQHGLFAPATPAPEKLQLMLARMAGVVGQANLGSAELLDTHRADAFVMREFAPSQSQKLNTKDTKGTKDTKENGGGSEYGAPRLALRVFRPPLQAAVEVSGGRPVRVRCAPRLGEKPEEAIGGRVLWCAGPWRTNGEWWGEAVDRFTLVVSRDVGSPRRHEDTKVPKVRGFEVSHGTASTNSGNRQRETGNTRFSRDEWDIALRVGDGVEIYRLVRNVESEAWLVGGLYD